MKYVKVKLSLYQAVEAHMLVRRRGSHIFSRQSAHRWRWGCQPHAPAAPLPPGIFLVLIAVRGWMDPRATVRLEGLGKLKKSSDLNGNRTHDLPACSLLLQPTTLPRAFLKISPCPLERGCPVYFNAPRNWAPCWSTCLYSTYSNS
jgi:hypothetical protein